MKISGNQTSILEILKLLDKNFKDPWGCYQCRHLPRDIKTDCNHMICDRFDKFFENQYGCHNYILEVDYDGMSIKFIEIIHEDHTNANILSGNVR